MKRLMQYRVWIYCSLATLLLTAYVGKALHTHNEAYYTALLMSQSAASEQGSEVMDDCPICHYGEFLFTKNCPLDFQFFASTLLYVIEAHPTAVANEISIVASLRGPPALS